MRTGLNVLDADLQRCFSVLRYLDFPDKSLLPCMAELYQDPVAVTERLATLEGTTPAEMKVMITAVGNLRHATAKHALCDAWLQNFKLEYRRIIDRQIRMRPDVYKAVLQEGGPNPDLSFMFLVDQDGEYEIVQRFDSVHGSNEYDGVAFFFKSDTEADLLFEDISAKVAPMRITRKPYGDWKDMAKVKYPELDWSHVNPMPADTWLRRLQQCTKAAAQGPVHVRNQDTVFADVIRGRTDMCLHHSQASSKKYDYWDSDKGRWIVDCDTTAMAEVMRAEMRECYGRLCFQVIRTKLHRTSFEW